jgi:hypothetical protein
MEQLKGNLLIAPCGMNCGICMAYLREKNRCAGCRTPDEGKPISLLRCKIRTCVILKKSKAKYCCSCTEFPCANLKHLDKRYRTKYSMSMIENLNNIKSNGINRFLKAEKARWACPKCGGTICVHKGICVECGKNKKCAGRGVSVVD